MYVYAVCCQMSESGRARLDDALRGIGSSSRILETQWLIKTDLSAAQVAEPLRPLIEPGDALVVVEVKNDWAAPGLFGTPAFESLANVFH